MITVVNLNPCIDKTVWIESFKYGGLNRVKDSRIDVAGKGINVAVAFTQLRGKAICTGINYVEKGRLVESFLDEAGIKHDLITVPGEVRVNIKLFDESRKTVTEINESGYPVPKDIIASIKSKLTTYAKQSTIVVLSGSVPRGIPSTIYRELLELVSELPVKTILDAEGELLLEGLRGKPDIIKPNLYELETALKTRLNSHRDIVHGARVFIKQGVGIVGVSMGKEGAMIIDDKRAYYAPGMKVDVKGTAGAGDSFVAGLCLAIEEDKDIKDMLRYGVAAATASVIQAGTELCNREDFERLLARVEIEELNI